MAPPSTLDHWVWRSDLDLVKIFWASSQLVLYQPFKNGYSKSLPHNIVQYIIFKHP